MSEQNSNIEGTEAEVTETETVETTEAPAYTAEQFGQVRAARHAVRDALAKFFKVVAVASDTDTSEVTRLSSKSRSAMRGIVGISQDSQVQRFDWVKENVEAALAALGQIEPVDEVDTKALALATAVAQGRVLPLVAEGRALAADRDFDAYKAAKDAYNAKQRGSYSGYPYRGSSY